MVVDTSALIAILFEEPERDDFIAAISRAAGVAMPAPSHVEASIVVTNRVGIAALADLDTLIADLEIDIIPFTHVHARAARDAFLRYGKGRHPAGLNFGDCMAYAVAMSERMPLLFKGEDFAQTDVKAAV